MCNFSFARIQIERPNCDNNMVMLMICNGYSAFHSNQGIVTRCASIGLLLPSEQAWGHIMQAAQGAGMVVPNLLLVLKELKKMLKNKDHQGPVKVVEYPATPLELGEDMLREAYSPDDPPASLDDLSVLHQPVVLRKSHKSVRDTPQLKLDIMSKANANTLKEQQQNQMMQLTNMLMTCMQQMQGNMGNITNMGDVGSVGNTGSGDINLQFLNPGRRATVQAPQTTQSPESAPALPGPNTALALPDAPRNPARGMPPESAPQGSLLTSTISGIPLTDQDLDGEPLSPEDLDSMMKKLAAKKPPAQKAPKAGPKAKPKPKATVAKKAKAAPKSSSKPASSGKDSAKVAWVRNKKVLTMQDRLLLWPSGCPRCRHVAGCTPSCVTKRGYTLKK